MKRTEIIVHLIGYEGDPMRQTFTAEHKKIDWEHLEGGALKITRYGDTETMYDYFYPPTLRRAEVRTWDDSVKE